MAITVEDEHPPLSRGPSKRRAVARVRITGVALLALLALGAAAAPAKAFVYWANSTSGSIGRAELDGTGADQRFVTGANSPRGVAVDAAHVYWANSGSGTIGRANLDGTGVNQRFITGAGGPTGVAVDAAHVYWVNPSSGTIGRANLDGTGVNQSFITVLGGVAGVAVDAAHVYWADPGRGAIGRANLDGTGINQRFIAGGGPVALAIGAGHIYWANLARGTIGRANLDGTGANQSFINAGAPRGVAVDTAHVYWANTNAIGRASLDGTGPNQGFISGSTNPWGVAVDALQGPVLGKSVNAEAVRGTIRVRAKGQNRFHVLRGTESIPVGSSVDATKGKVRLASAKKGGGNQSTVFFDGQFKISQSRRTGLTDEKLEGGNLRSCPSGSRSGKVARRVLRRLWGHGTGRTRTSGHNGSGTVRGTFWLTEDRCDGTLFKVREGVVVVRDFTRHRTVVLHAGQQYLAPARIG